MRRARSGRYRPPGAAPRGRKLCRLGAGEKTCEKPNSFDGVSTIPAACGGAPGSDGGERERQGAGEGGYGVRVCNRATRASPYLACHFVTLLSHSSNVRAKSILVGKAIPAGWGEKGRRKGNTPLAVGSGARARRAA